MKILRPAYGFIKHYWGAFLAGFIVAISIGLFVAFGRLSAVQKDSRDAATAASQAASNQAGTITAISDAVTDLKKDNGQQTIILCKLILGSRTTLTDEEKTEVESICNEKLKETEAASALGNQNSTSRSNQNTNNTTNQGQSNNQPQSPPPPENPPVQVFGVDLCLPTTTMCIR